MPRVLLVIVLLGIVVVAARGAFRAGPAPVIAIEPAAKAIGARTPVTVTATEASRGLTGVKVEFVQGDRTETLVAKTYNPASAWAFGGRGRAATRSSSSSVGTSRRTSNSSRDDPRHRDPRRELAAPPGPCHQGDRPPRAADAAVACGRVVVHLREPGRMRGRRLSRRRDLRQGRGPCGRLVLPGFPLPGGGPQDRFALFAVPYDLGDTSKVRLTAEDEVGNSASATMIDKFFPSPLHRDTIPLDDAFLGKVVPSILSQTPELTDKGDLLANYLQINRDLRKTDNAQLIALAAQLAAAFPLDPPVSGDGLDEGHGAFRRPPELRVPREDGRPAGPPGTRHGRRGPRAGSRRERRRRRASRSSSASTGTRWSWTTATA